MNMRPGTFLLSGFISALTLLGANTTFAQEQPSDKSAASPPASEAQPSPPAPSYSEPPPAPGYRPQAQAYPPSAAAPPLPPGYHQHDGFYFRLHVGVGYLRASGFSLYSKRTLVGVNIAASGALGVAVIENLIVYAEAFVSAGSQSDVIDGTGASRRASATLLGFGPGVTYYVDPINNVYLSAALNFAILDSSAGKGLDDTSKLGYSFGLGLGKEWWVSSNWGLGAAAQFRFAAMKEKGFDRQMTALGIAALFSATYN